jgi:hypothetical protein
VQRRAAPCTGRQALDARSSCEVCAKGHTRSMFDRYKIIDERDLRAGLQKLAGVTSESHSGSSAESTPT